MKHIIVGSGVVGQATGKWLLANKEEVLFNDINEKIVEQLNKEGYNATSHIEKVDPKEYSIIWICTAEWNTEKALSKVAKFQDEKLGNLIIYVIRSTTLPGTTKELKEKYKIRFIAHNPEFLRASTAIEDMFNPDRIIIGTDCHFVYSTLYSIYKTTHAPIVNVDFTSSEVIKLASNCWLATQISYWNEIKKICEKFNLNPQAVANACTLDKRISKYGSKMVGTPYSGFCLPKDMETFSNLFKEKDLHSEFLHLVSRTNKDERKKD